MELQVKRVCENAATRILTLPETHPLNKVAQRASKHIVKRHRSPLHILMALTPWEPRDVEKVEVVRRKPGWKSRVKINIAKDRKEAIQQVQEERADIEIFTDGSGIDRGVGAAVVVYMKGERRLKVLRKYLGKEKAHTVFEAECVGQLMGLEAAKEERGIRTVSIFTDNQVAIQATKSNLLAPGHYITDELHQAVLRLEKCHMGVEVKMVWVPGHKGVEENERADREAKRAARGKEKGFCGNFLRKGTKVAKAVIKAELARERTRETRARFKKSPRFQWYKAIEKEPTARTFERRASKLPRQQSSLLVQLRTRHIALQKYLKNIRQEESDTCEHCG